MAAADWSGRLTRPCRCRTTVDLKDKHKNIMKKQKKGGGSGGGADEDDEEEV